MKTFMLNKLIDMALPIVVGLIIPSALDALKRANGWLDKAPASVKQASAFIIAGLATALAQMLGITVPTDLASWDAPLLHTVLAGLLGIAIKQQKQVKKFKVQQDAIPPLAAPRRPIPVDSPFHIPTEGDGQ
jgi:hypothetical protein